MSPTKSKPYKLKSSKSSLGTTTSSDGNNLVKRRPRTQVGDSDSEETRKVSRSAALKATLLAKEEPWRWNPVIKFILDLEEDPTVDLRIFPRYAIWFLMLLTFWSRYLIMKSTEGMSIIDPQEQFPIIESAHIEVYGYGLNINESSYTTNETSNHTELSPAWIYRQIYISLFRAKQRLGLTSSPFSLARGFHAFIAAFTPWCVYHFSRTLFGQCRDMAFMSANLVAFSKHLILYGIHPLSQSLLSPFIFLAITVVFKVWTANNSVVRSLTLLLCGIVFGVVIYIQADSLVHLFVIFLLLSPTRVTNRLQYFPTSLKLTSALTVVIGAILGLQFGAVQDRIHRRSWDLTPVALFKIRLANYRNLTHSLVNFYSFLSVSHVHWALVALTIVCSFMYLSFKQRWTVIFDSWLNGYNHQALFKTSAKLSLASFVLLLLYSTYPHQLWFAQDALILLFVAGSSAVYLLYRGLYIFVVTVANPRKTTKNIIKLIVYGELFLYMFESRLTFPNSANQSISSWSHKGLWESTQVNWCLRYVSQQWDVTGVYVDYPVEMTGGYSLLHHRVPAIWIFGSQFGEWDVESRGLSDLYSLRNPQQLMRYAANSTTYNYFVMTGGRKFFSYGFRRVFNSSNVRVYKRSKSFTERQRLEEALNKLSSQSGADAWTLKDAASLAQLGLNEKAVERVNSRLERDQNSLESWQLLIHVMRRMRHPDLDKTVNRCKTVLGTGCNEQIDVSSLFETDGQWNITYRFI